MKIKNNDKLTKKDLHKSKTLANLHPTNNTTYEKQ